MKKFKSILKQQFERRHRHHKSKQELQAFFRKILTNLRVSSQVSRIYFKKIITFKHQCVQKIS